jgi:MFS family permease
VRPDDPAKDLPSSEGIFSPDFLFANVANLFVSLGQQMLIATLPVYVIRLGGSTSEAGFVTGSAALVALLARPLSGWLVDTWRRRPVVLLGCLSYVAASIVYLLSSSVGGLSIGRAFHGFALSNYTTAANTYVADIAPRRRRAEAIGVFAATADIGIITGPAVGFAIAAAFGFHELFLASTAMAALALVCSVFARERRAPSLQKRAPWSLRNGLIAPQALPLAFVAFCLGLGIGPLNTFLSIFASGRGIDNPGLYFTVQAAALLLTRTIAGRLADRRGRAFVIVPGMIASALAIAVLPLAYDLPHFFISAVLWGVGFGAAQPASLALLVDVAGGSQRGLALSTYFMGFDVGIGIGAIAMGYLSQTVGWEIMWPVSAGCVLVGLLGVFWSHAEPRRE